MQQSLGVLFFSLVLSWAAHAAPYLTQYPDTIGIEHAHQALHKIHIYKSNQPADLGGTNDNNSAVALAIDSHHFLTPYLFVSSTIIHNDERIFVNLANGMNEVYLQYIDIFSGLALLYSPNEVHEKLILADVNLALPNLGEKLKVVSLPGDNFDGMNASFTGIVHDDIHQVYTLKSLLNPSGIRSNGAVVINQNGKIVGIYQGNYYVSSVESFTPSSSFLYLLQKAAANSFFQMDPQAARRQLASQLTVLQTRLMTSLERPSYLKNENMGDFSIREMSDDLKCEKSLTPNLTYSCVIGLPLFSFPNRPAVEIRAKFQLLDESSKADLGRAIDVNSQATRELFKDQTLVCSQQRTELKFSADSQVHFCASKENFVEFSTTRYDSLIRGVTLGSASKKSLYFEFLFRGFSSNELKRGTQLMVNTIRQEILP